MKEKHRILRFGILAAIIAGASILACSRHGGAPEAATLNLFAWSEYVPADVIDGFTKETGIRVNYDTFPSNEELITKLASGSAHYDLIQPSEYTTEALIQANMLQPLDFSALPNAKNYLPEFMHLPFDPDQKYTLPYMAGTVGIVVNREKVKDDVRGFADLFDDRHKGRIVCLADNREMVVWALLTLKKDINDIGPETLALARPIVERWSKNVKIWDSDSPKTPLLNGDVDLGVVWSGEAARLLRESPKFGFVMPVEGSHMYIDSLAIPKDAKNVRAAHLFMDYIARPEISAKISKAFPYTNPNREARALLGKEDLANPASYPDMRGFPTFRHIGKRAADVDRMMTDVRAGN